MDANHWESIYRRKHFDEVSWFQPEATLSLRLICEVAPVSAAILDVGGGASTLVDGLVQAGYGSVSVLDISQSGLEQARARLGPESRKVNWIHADILTAELPDHSIDVWHDRAVFHFFTDARSRDRYIRQVKRIVRPHGLVLVATFAEDGPTQCSGFPVQRYNVDQLHGVFGPEFTLVASQREQHVTPSGKEQSFVYCMCRYDPHGLARTAA